MKYIIITALIIAGATAASLTTAQLQPTKIKTLTVIRTAPVEAQRARANAAEAQVAALSIKLSAARAAMRAAAAKPTTAPADGNGDGNGDGVYDSHPGQTQYDATQPAPGDTVDGPSNCEALRLLMHEESHYGSIPQEDTEAFDAYHACLGN